MNDEQDHDSEFHEMVGNRSLLIPARNVHQYVSNTLKPVNNGEHAYVPMDRAFIQFQHDSDTKYGHHSVHYVLDNGDRIGSLHWHKTYGNTEHEGPAYSSPEKRGKALKGRFAKDSNNIVRYTLHNVATSIAQNMGLTLPRN
jgi:hypothetical protein